MFDDTEIDLLAGLVAGELKQKAGGRMPLPARPEFAGGIRPHCGGREGGLG